MTDKRSDENPSVLAENIVSEPLPRSPLEELDNTLNTYLACQRFYNVATSAICTTQEQDDELLIQGTYITTCWLNQQAEELQRQLESAIEAHPCREIKEPARVYRVV